MSTTETANKKYIWVMVTGGIMGFTPDDIDDFNRDYKHLSKYVKGLDYWSYFNFYFKETLQLKEAYCFWNEIE